MVSLFVITALLLLVSLVRSPQKTAAALKIAGKRGLFISVALAHMIVAVALVLYWLPDRFIADHLVKTSSSGGVVAGSLLGSIAVMPGFIAFPLGSMLVKQGVPYMTISAFTSTLMMVGIVTFPIEKKYLGAKLAVVRNGVGLLISLAVAVVTGFAYGEIL